MTVDDIFVVLWRLIGAVSVLAVWLLFVTVRLGFHAGRLRRNDMRVARVIEKVDRDREVTHELRAIVDRHVEQLSRQMTEQHDLLIDVGKAVSGLVERLERLREAADGSGVD